jgi:hypothetical protein
MADQWYYARNNQKHGPLTPQQLRQAAATGRLQATDMVWKEGMQKWVPASSIQGLFPPPQAAAAGPPRITPAQQTGAGDPAPTQAGSVSSALGTEPSHRLLPRKAVWAVAAAGAGVCVLVICVTGAIVLGLSKKTSQGNDSHTDTAQADAPLTEEFFPMKTELKRNYTLRLYGPPKEGEEPKFKETRGFSEWKPVGNDRVQAWGIEPDTRLLYYNAESGRVSQERDGFRKTGSGIDSLASSQPKVWHQFLKFGVKPGEKWESSAPQVNQSYRYFYVKCDKFDGIPCAVVTEMEGETKRRLFLLKGVGIIRYDLYTSFLQRRHVDQWVPVSQQFYEEWKGDIAPLAVEQWPKAKK